jgi:hypothetical protein
VKLPPNLVFHPDHRLMVWEPRGVLDEKAVNQVLAFLGTEETMSQTPFNRFTDLTALDEIDLNFDYVFHVAIYRRVSYGGRPAIKSAFLVKGNESVHYSKLHALLTGHSPLHVRIFEEREAAAAWLNVPVDLLIVSSSQSAG